MKMLKKLVCAILLAVGLVAGGYTESVAQDYSGLLKGPTTLTNAVTDSVVVAIKGSRSAIGFGYGIVKTSGAVSGTITLQYKLTTLASEKWKSWHVYTLKDGDRDTTISLNYNPAVQWKIVTTTGASQVSVHRKFLLYRK